MTPKRKQWNIWRIKSPWVRVPVGVVFAIATIAIYALLSIFAVVYGACQGAWDGLLTWFEEMDFKMLWMMVSDWRRA